MPADVGTKAVGPARLEDLIRVCDLWAPHLHVSSEPPRPQVASLTGGQTNVAKALLAMLLLILVSGAKAAADTLPVGDGQRLWQSFVVGFGFGCGLWMARKMGVIVDRCFGKVFQSKGPGAESSQLVRRSVQVQTEDEVLQDGLETGERDPFPVQSEGVCLFEGDEAEWLLKLQERMYEPSGDGGLSMEQARGSQEYVTDRSASSEMGGRYQALDSGIGVGLGMRDYWDARGSYLQAQTVDVEYVRYPVGRPPEEMLADARAPTVPRPPGYPVQLLNQDQMLGPRQDNRLVYGDDEALIEEVFSDESSIGQWTTDSGMPRGYRSSDDEGSALGEGEGISRARHSRAGSMSSRSAISLGIASLAASVTGVDGRVSAPEESDGSWELILLVGAVALLFSVVGAACACCAMKFLDISGRSDQGLEISGGTPCNKTRRNIPQNSPIVNVTLNNRMSEWDADGDSLRVALERNLSASSHSSDNSRPPRGVSPGTSRPEQGLRKRRADISRAPEPLRPCGLSPGRTRVHGDEAPSATTLPDTTPVVPSGLGPGRTRVHGDEAPSATTLPDPTPVVPSGLGPGRTRAQGVETPRATKWPDPTPVVPSGLGPDRTSETEGEAPLDVTVPNPISSSPSGLDLTRSRVPGDSGENCAFHTKAGVAESVPVDRLRRPWGLKKNEIMSCRPANQRTIVYLTKNGGCVHSSMSCRPMQYASAPIVRNLCVHCVDGGRLPTRKCSQSGSEREAYFTKSGECIHLSKSCAALDCTEEVNARTLCKCCRWG